MKSSSTLILAIATLTLGCSHHSKGKASNANSTSPQAKAELAPLANSKVQGELLFRETSEGVKVWGKVSGLEPNSVHGFHVHEKGDCSAADGSSAGGHFNPEKHEHGALNQDDTHDGDLGNIQANEKGIAYIDLFRKNAKLLDAKDGYLTRAIIVHEKNDDLHSQPSGNAGARIACAVIQNAPYAH